MEPIQNSIPDIDIDIDTYDFVSDWNQREGNLKDGFNCPECKNRGYRYVYYEDMQGNYYRQECECMNRRRFIHSLKSKGLSDMLHFKVNNFEVTQEFQKVMKQLAYEYVTQDAREWLCYVGQSGTGKTHLSSAVIVTLAEKNCNVEYMMWTSFISDVKDSLTLDSELDKEQIMNTYKQAEVLYIDDLFKGKTTEYTKEIAFDLINYRYVNHLTTVITSELSLQEMTKVEEAVSGRIKERCGKYFYEIPKDIKKNYRFRKG